MKKKMGIIVLATMLVTSLLVGCGTKVENTGEVSGTEVIAILNGEEITREEVGTSLTVAEQTAISDYLIVKAISEFYTKAGVSVSDSEVALQMELYKQNQSSWDQLLAAYNGDKTKIAEEVRLSLLEDAWVKAKTSEYEITDDEIDTIYDANPLANDYMEVSVIQYTDVTMFEDGKRYIAEGKTLEEVAAATGQVIIPEQKLQMSSEGYWENKAVGDCVVGDLLVTTTYMTIGQVTAINEGKDNEAVRETISEVAKENRAYEALQVELMEYMQTVESEIMGVPYSLYAGTPITEENKAIVQPSTLPAEVGAPLGDATQEGASKVGEALSGVQPEVGTSESKELSPEVKENAEDFK